MEQLLSNIKNFLINVYFKIKYGKKLKIKGLRNTFFNNKKCVVINGEESSIEVKGFCIVGKNSKISAKNGGKIEIGENFFANDNFGCNAFLGVKIGNNVSFGPNVIIYDNNHMFNEHGQVHGEYRCEEITIGDNTWIGANCMILKGSKIGKNCVIGAGTVVKEEIPDNSLVTMNRTLVIKKLEKNYDHKKK